MINLLLCLLLYVSCIIDALWAVILEAYTKRHLEMEGIGGPPASQKGLFMSLEQLLVEIERLEFIIGTELKRNNYEGKGKTLGRVLRVKLNRP